MAVGSSAKIVKIERRDSNTSVNDSSEKLNALDNVTAKEGKQAKTNTREAVKKAKLRRERVELVKHLYNIMHSTHHSSCLADNSSGSECQSEDDQWRDSCDDDFAESRFQRRKGTNCRRRKRERIPSKERKFIDFCREHEKPENITLERGRKKAIRVKFYKCSKQMLRDSNCKEQNLDRKANIEKKLKKRGLRRLETYRTANGLNSGDQDLHPAAERFALREENVPKEMQDMLDFLLCLQDREITPEDYELLLRLDESVPTKTVSDQRLASLKEDRVREEHVDETCGICMENYEVGQTRKSLPCEHVFHSHCIDTWLSQSSTKCPLDGREI